MIIKNNLAKQLTVLLDGKAYVFNAGESMEVSEKEGSFILCIQPLLVAVKEEKAVIHSEPAAIETPTEKPKAKKNVAKNKKSGK